MVDLLTFATHWFDGRTTIKPRCCVHYCQTPTIPHTQTTSYLTIFWVCGVSFSRCCKFLDHRYFVWCWNASVLHLYGGFFCGVVGCSYRHRIVSIERSILDDQTVDTLFCTKRKTTIFDCSFFPRRVCLVFGRRFNVLDWFLAGTKRHFCKCLLHQYLCHWQYLWFVCIWSKVVLISSSSIVFIAHEMYLIR